ncbi:class I SAM-dependent DNA methyltransferase [Streptomyces sp. BE303]|uniref:class I SAM-dependent DNA methyltransferase n=1 Tax=Streptomyces sp. BE303 TaxID=3002528 RepID=UPI002E78E92E|nr:class I SAM-dependent methyltransferase [Streptomyces sp. BE303]MED7948827.1 class I SAM-dependent methyltransferase [Streptomyces sp. BE303]
MADQDPYYAAAFAAHYDDWFPSYVTDSTVALLADLAESAGAGPVLELGSGTGRIAIPLARRGLDVHGIEGTPAMTDRLRSKPGGHAIPVTTGDFSHVPVDGEFALVYVVNGTFFELPTQEAQIRCFANTAARLGPDGLFVLDAHVPEALAAPEAAVASLPIPGGVTVRTRRINRATQQYTSHYLVHEGGTVHHVPVSFRYAATGELDLMATMAGLRLRDRYGDWRGGAYTSASTYHVSVYERPA